MSRKKIAISLEEKTVRRLDTLVSKTIFPNRSQAIQEALDEKFGRLDRGRLARECAQLDPAMEKSMAEEGMGTEAEEWPKY